MKKYVGTVRILLSQESEIDSEEPIEAESLREAEQIAREILISFVPKEVEIDDYEFDLREIQEGEEDE